MPKRSKPTRRTVRVKRTGRYLKQIAISATAVVAVVLVVALVTQAATGGGNGKASGEITAAQAQEQIQAGAVVLDVRSREEYTEGHIAQSLWIPLEELSGSRLDSLPRDRLLIVVCRSGVRSAQGRDTLLAAGFTEVVSITGGLQAWVAQNLPLVTGEPVP